MTDWPRDGILVEHKPIALWAVWAPEEEQAYKVARVLSTDRAMKLYGASRVEFRDPD